MPAWVKNDSKWKKAAELISKRQGDKPESEFTDKDWASTAAIYKKMGGAIQKSMDSPSMDNLIEAAVIARAMSLARSPSDAPFTVAVDFDNTISQYEGWKGRGDYGPPFPDVQKVLEILKGLGMLIIIFTVRNEPEEIEAYCRENEIPFDFINFNPFQPPGSSRKISADVYLDDRAVHFGGSWRSALFQILAAYSRKGEED